MNEVRVTKTSDGLKVSVWGGGTPFPITAYRSQWEVVFDHLEEIKEFVATLPENIEG
jgi:hypothetical protein